MRTVKSICFKLKYLLWGLCIFYHISVHGMVLVKDRNKTNLALHLDGKDNNVRTGMGILEPAWTLEAWVKGDDTQWKDLEVIIGGGEYSELNWVDNLPLVVKKGRVGSVGCDLYASDLLDDQWHHVALACNGRETLLFMDGRQVAQADTALAILPGAIGVHDTDFTFGGLIDEVRIWREALPAEVIRKWMNGPVQREHPCFEALWGYYNFDDLKDERTVNWVGKGHQAYHLRNGRNKYNGKAPLAYAVPNDNAGFKNYNGKQQLFNAVAIQNEWDIDQGTSGSQAIKLRIAVQGSQSPMSLTELSLDLSQLSSLKDIDRVHVFYTGDQARSAFKKEIFGTGKAPQRKMKFSAGNKETIRLAPGINYFLVTVDVNPEAEIGHDLCMRISSFKLDRKTYRPEVAPEEIHPQVTVNSIHHARYVKVLQWNIWHGGVHLGNEGRLRILELIRATQADVVMMQEAYGIQQVLADSLGYYLKTYSKGDNLALFSRFPLEPLEWREPFKSNPAKSILPNGKRVLLVDSWLRYAYRPEYTSGYANKGLDPSVWIAEDSLLALKDIQDIYTQDVLPYMEKDMPIIISGDFNSCSHLDWTERARGLHYGYGPVPFPVSIYMQKQGFKDSFREKNPDEVAYQGGSVAAIYGQMQMSRIDFIYYKGDMKVVSSKIIRTTPEIDDVWASDHAAVMTVFEVR